MYTIKIIFITLLALSTSASAWSVTDFPFHYEFQQLWQMIFGNTFTTNELGRSRGQCNYTFLNYISQRDKYECALDDVYIKHLLQTPEQAVTPRKPPILVKCLQPELSTNATTAANDNSMLIMSSVKEIVSLLKPIGNATKRHEPGSCVVVLFYTDSCYGCARVAAHANILPKFFPTLRIAAIDAFKFTSFNTEFGIVGLPTLLLFHQGRPIVKYYMEAGTYPKFITRHTGIKAIERVPSAKEIYGPLPLLPVKRTDYNLWLAWAFIFLCLGNYFLKSRLCQQITEMIKRNWRESEAQMEQNT